MVFERHKGFSHEGVNKDPKVLLKIKKSVTIKKNLLEYSKAKKAILQLCKHSYFRERRYLVSCRTPAPLERLTVTRWAFLYISFVCPSQKTKTMLLCLNYCILASTIVLSGKLKLNSVNGKNAKGE